MGPDPLQPPIPGAAACHLSNRDEGQAGRLARHLVLLSDELGEPGLFRAAGIWLLSVPRRYRRPPSLRPPRRRTGPGPLPSADPGSHASADLKLAAFGESASAGGRS